MKIEFGGTSSAVAALLAPPARPDVAAASPAAPAAPRPEPAPAPEPRDVSEVVEKLNARFAPHRMEAQYSIDEHTKDIIIKIVNADSGEVVRQIPTESALRLVAALRTTSPHLLDEKA